MALSLSHWIQLDFWEILLYLAIHNLPPLITFLATYKLSEMVKEDNENALMAKMLHQHYKGAKNVSGLTKDYVYVKQNQVNVPLPWGGGLQIPMPQANQVQPVEVDKSSSEYSFSTQNEQFNQFM